MNYYLLYTVAFLIGGNAYCSIELIYRARTHYSMFFCAGLSIIVLLSIYLNNRSISPILFGIYAMITITSLEFLFGYIFNILLKMNVWDYSKVPMNIFGQICIPFSLIWLGFGLIIYAIFKIIKI